MQKCMQLVHAFRRDLKKYDKDKTLLAHIRETILEVEAAPDITAIKNLKKLKDQGSFYRIRVGNYRIGIVLEEQTVTFVRALHRKEIYRYFP